MNKQEAIKKVEQMGEYEHFVDEPISKKGVLNILNQLDEPQKVKVPQFVADWIRKCKTFKNFVVSLSFALQPSVWEANGLSDESIEWLANAENQELFARAWLDGYEVEEEKRYRVKFKNISELVDTLNRHKSSKSFIIANPEENSIYDTKFTRKELEEGGFGWVFNCEGVQIEEVE